MLLNLGNIRIVNIQKFNSESESFKNSNLNIRNMNYWNNKILKIKLPPTPPPQSSEISTPTSAQLVISTWNAEPPSYLTRPIIRILRVHDGCCVWIIYCPCCNISDNITVSISYTIRIFVIWQPTKIIKNVNVLYVL